MKEILQRISDDLQMPQVIIEEAVKFSRSRSRHFSIPKRSGGSRRISQPSVLLKPVLEWIAENILRKLPVHEISTAFSAGNSILENAARHRDSFYSVRIDLQEFFPSIRPMDIEESISSATSIPEFLRSPDLLRLLALVCYDRDGGLPIGFSTSPLIANAAMHGVDSILAKEIGDKERLGLAKITRYADDFIFSTDKKGACAKFLEFLEFFLSALNSPRLSINQKKTRFMSRAGGSTIITGLRINNQGAVVVHAHYRDHVRLLLKLFEEGRLASFEVPKLVGHLAHIQHVDPSFFTKLSFRYHQQISSLRLGSVGA